MPWGLEGAFLTPILLGPEIRPFKFIAFLLARCDSPPPRPAVTFRSLLSSRHCAQPRSGKCYTFRLKMLDLHGPGGLPRSPA